MKVTSLRETITKILAEYKDATREPFASHPIGSFFRDDIRDLLFQSGIVDPATYTIKGSVGQGQWATIPWICILDKKITSSPQTGVYIVYLLSSDGKTLYLTLNQGCTDIRSKNSKQATMEHLQNEAHKIRNSVDSRGFQSDDLLNLGNDLPELAECYEKGTIYYKEYKAETLQSDEEIKQDLKNMLLVYQDYVILRDLKSNHHEVNGWLLTWNPNNWSWTDYLEAVESTHEGTPYYTAWTCANSNATVGDKVFLMVLGKDKQNGIIASGTVTRERFLSDHWYQTSKELGEQVYRIGVAFDEVIDYSGYSPLSPDFLERRFPNQHWRPQQSGIKINTEYLTALKEEWDLSISVEKNPESQEESLKNKIEAIKEYISSQGFSFEPGLIENFYLSLKSKPFVILAGTSGTGKSRFVKLFAEAIGSTTSNGRYKMIAVRPDWSDSSDLFGHVDLNGKFLPGAILDFIKRAANDVNYPYFLCLDEMNLARVEYYFSDFLSIIETRELNSIGEIISDPLIDLSYYGNDFEAVKEFGIQRFPENLYVIGTVNMDETTFQFSKKVLDRANTIEFSYVDLNPNFLEWKNNGTLPSPQSNSLLKSRFIHLFHCEIESELVAKICFELTQINQILSEAGAQFGYRVRDEIVYYVINNKLANLLSEDDAFDNGITQKVLTRIQGSSSALRNTLEKLFKYCAGDFSGLSGDSGGTYSAMMQIASRPECRYPRSAKKIAFMVRRCEEDGFTSYWL